MESLSAIGLMSGTSLDGVDLAWINTNGETIGRIGPTGYRAYSEDERNVLRAALAAAPALDDRDARPPALVDAERLVTETHAEAVETFMAANGIDRSAIAVIGFHGQTVLHRPDQGLTVQLGDGRALARRLRIPVVYDFRAADLAAGGEGAPFVPVFHQALAATLGEGSPVALVNIGGVANVTFVGADGSLCAFDTGPGNALLDDFMLSRTGQPHDLDGRTSAGGTVDEQAVGRALQHPYFVRRPPKSLDRNEFRAWIAEAGLLATNDLADGAATLTALTAATIAHAADLAPQRPTRWIVAGGGRHNPTLMRMLAERLTPAEVIGADTLGWCVDALEAQAFAYLAVRSLRGLPLTFPGTTGVSRPVTGGVLARP